MRQLVGIVLKPLDLLFVGLGANGCATRAEQEALQANEHSTTLQILGLTRLVEHSLQTVSIRILEHFLNAIIKFHLELLFFHVLELFHFTVDIVKVNAPQLFVTHHLLHALELYVRSPLLGELCA